MQLVRRSLITVEIYNKKSRTTKFVPVLFNPRDETFIPEPISAHTHYLLNSEDNYAKLYAFLTGQAGVMPRKLGPLKTLARESVDALTFGGPVDHRPRIASHEDVLDWGNSWRSGHKLLRRLIALDKRILGPTLNQQREGTTEQWAPVFMHNPDSYALLVVNGKRIVGYWSFAALRKEQFDRAKAGKLLDSEITKDKIEPMDYAGEYLLYFVLFVVEEEHRSHGGGMLIRAFLERLEVLAAKRSIFFKEICANAFTKDGQRLCDKFEMNHLGKHEDYGEVFHKSLAGDWPRALNDKPVAELYRRHFQRPVR